MRFLILSCNTGGGHNTAAKAIKERAESLGIHCDVQNALQFTPKVKEAFITKGHVFAYTTLPKVYGMGYRLSENLPSDHLLREFSRYGEDLYPYLCAQVYDAVICVHVFPAMMMTGVRKKHNYRVPVFFVATDYTCSPGVETVEVDRWFVPKGLSAEFASHGINQSKIVESGIPVDYSLYHPKTQTEARSALQLDPNAPIVLLSSGSMGAGRMNDMARNIIDHLPKNALLYVMCGTNQKTILSLSGINAIDRVIPMGFTDQMPLWLSAADLLLSKAGGLTSTEAVTVGLPVIFFDAVPGLESYNMEHLISLGCARGSTKEALGKNAAALLLDRSALSKMREKQAFFFKDCAADTLVRSVLSMIR